MAHIAKILTLSMAHIRPETFEKLVNGETAFPAYKYTYGAFVYLCSDTNATEWDIEYPEELEDLRAAVQFARNNGCEMICFDSDGTVEEDLTVYHWDADDEKNECTDFADTPEGYQIGRNPNLVKWKEQEEKFCDKLYRKAIDDFRNEVIALCKSHSVGADDRHENKLLYAHEDGTWHSLLDDVTELLKAGKENVKKSHTGTDPD